METKIAHQFFQWLRLCDEVGGLNHECVFEPSASFLFPISDFTKKSPGKIVVNFLSLLGAGSPLPHHFNTPMLFSSKENEAYYAFMTLLNNIFYRALYAAWKSNHWHFFRQHRGMYHELWSSYAPTPWLARVHLQLVPTHLGLRVLLNRLYPKIPIEIVPSQTFQTITDNQPLKRLSNNALLGKRVLSHDGHITLSVGPLPCAQAKAWLPHATHGKKLLTQVKKYLGAHYQVHWQIKISEQISLTYLNGKEALSEYAFLGASSHQKILVFD